MNNETPMNDGTGIPVSRRGTCAYCAILVDTAAVGTFQLCTGWVENRRKGGGNTVALPTRHLKWACGICIDKLRHGISPDQASLFALDMESYG